MIEFAYQLPYPPTVNHIYKRDKRGRVFMDARAKAYREEVILIIGKGHTTLLSEISVRVDAYMPDKRKRDIDNICKALFDAMTHAGVWKDDSQIKQILINRRGVEAPGRVVVIVTPF
jgi:crossover junction endodeoxyribonuclease RusA